MTPKRINIPKGSTCVTYLAYNLAFVLVTSRVREIVVWSSFGNLSAIGIALVFVYSVRGREREEGLDRRDVDWLSLGKCTFNWRLPHGYSPSF